MVSRESEAPLSMRKTNNLHTLNPDVVFNWKGYNLHYFLEQMSLQ